MNFYTYKISDFFEKPKNSNFHINKLEKMPVLPAKIKDPHKHSFYELFIVENGKMTHNVDYQEFNVNKNQLLFISKEQLHIWSKFQRDKNLSGFRLMFSEEYFLINQPNNQFLTELIFVDNVYHLPVINFESQKTNLFLYFEILFNEYQREKLNDSIVRNLLSLILLEIQRLINETDIKIFETQHIVLYKKFLFLLEKFFTKNFQVSNFAEKLNVTPQYLCKILKLISGKNFSQIVQDRINLESKRLLCYSNFNVNEISEILGFTETSYFIRFFRKINGETPLVFKKNYQKNTI